MLRRVEDQCRVKNGEAERREDLNEEQRGRSLRSRGEKAFQRFDGLRRPANLALRVTFNVIYPAAPARIRVHRALISTATPGDVKPAHDATSEKASGQFVSGDLSRFVA